MTESSACSILSCGIIRGSEVGMLSTEPHAWVLPVTHAYGSEVLPSKLTDPLKSSHLILDQNNCDLLSFFLNHQASYKSLQVARTGSRGQTWHSQPTWSYFLRMVVWALQMQQKKSCHCTRHWEEGDRCLEEAMCTSVGISVKGGKISPNIFKYSISFSGLYLS